MAHPKHFAPVLHRTLKAAIGRGELHILMDSNNGAIKLRRKFYAFRDALYLYPEFDVQLTLFAPYLRFEVGGNRLLVRVDHDAINNRLHPDPNEDNPNDSPSPITSHT